MSNWLTWTKVALVIAFIIHSALTYIAFSDWGYAGYFPPFMKSNTTQIFSDLVIALSLLHIWIFFDLKRRKLSLWWWPVIALSTAALGSFPAMVYVMFWPGPARPADEEGSA